MATRLQPKFMQESIPYEANKEVLFKMPRDRPYRRITLFVKFAVKGGGSTAPASRMTDHLRNVVRKIRFLRNGSDSKIHVSLNGLYYYQYYRYGVKPAESDIPTVGATGTSEYWVAVNLDFATFPRDLGDFTAIQPVRGLSSIHIGIEWGDIDDVFATPNGATIDADKTEILVSQIEAFENSAEPGPNDPGLAALLGKALDYRMLEESPTIITKEYDSFGLNELRSTQNPTPSFKQYELTRCIKNYGSDNWSYSNEVLTHWAVANVQGAGEPIFRAEWTPWWSSGRIDYMMDAQPDGIYLQNWNKLRQGGLRNVRVESLQNKYLTAAPAANRENAVITLSEYLAGAPEDAV